MQRLIVLLIIYISTINLSFSQFNFEPVKNINSSEQGYNSTLPKTVGDKIFFIGTTQEHGSELWITDIACQNTFLVKDIYEGPASSYVDLKSSVILDSILFFIANDGSKERLWRSNGTKAGTYYIENIQTPWSFESKLLCSMGGYIYFAGSQIISYDHRGTELYKTDGTTAGTSLVKDIAPGLLHSAPNSLTSFDNILYFSASDNINGEELWRSDGTPEGTYMVKDILPGKGSSIPESKTRFFRFKNTVFFSATDNNSKIELWATNSNTDSTYKVSVNSGNLLTFEFPADFLEVEEKLYFTTAYKNTYDTYVKKLWCYNSLTNTFSSISNISFYHNKYLTLIKNYIYIHGNNNSLYKVNTKTQAVSLVKSNLSVIDLQYSSGQPIAYINTVLNDKYFFCGSDVGSSNYELWAADSTGAYMVYNIAKGKKNSDYKSSLPRYITPIGGKLFFYAADNTSGVELWVSDGQINGETKMVKNLYTETDESSYPSNLLKVNNKLFFRAFSLTSTNYDDIYKDVYVYNAQSDTLINIFSTSPSTRDVEFVGTVGDRLLFTDTYYRTYITKPDFSGASILPVTAYNYSITTQSSVIYKNHLLFPAYVSPNLSSENLYKIDSLGNLSVVATKTFENGPFIELNDIVYFAGRIKNSYNSDLDGRELWRTDGTNAGTYMVKNILPGSENGIAASSFYKLGGTIYFSANNNLNGTELWRTDGTTDGTYRIAPITFGTKIRNVKFLANHLNKFFFAVEPFNSNSVSLWTSDGTSEGTYQLSNFNEQWSFYALMFSPVYKTTNFIIFNVNTFDSGYKVWKIDLQNFSLTPVNDATGRALEGYLIYGNEDYCLFEGRTYDPIKQNYVSGLGYLDGISANTKITNTGISPSSIFSIGNYGYLNMYTPDKGYELWKIRLCIFNKNLIASDDFIGIQRKESALNYVNAANKITGNSNVTFSAGKGITLTNGFSVEKGSIFKTELKGCQ